MPKRPKIRRNDDTELGEPNLIPIMSILVILIPMLIFAFNYEELAVQTVSLPKTGGAGKSGVKKLNLTVLVSEEGFRVKVQGESETVRPPPDKVIAKKKRSNCDPDGEIFFSNYDFAGLNGALVTLRDNKELGLEDTINIGAKDGIQWRILARTIDAVSFRRENDLYTDACEFKRAPLKKIEIKDAEGNVSKSVQELFPKVVFIVL
jgi:biopolymer transport protein ExbD